MGRRVRSRRLQARTSIWLAHRVSWLFYAGYRTRRRRARHVHRHR